jgi:uncharacterized membrane protein YphA (DoxX/SURF4 family)
MARLFIVRSFSGEPLEEAILEPSTVVLFAEAMLRAVLGWRMLISGLSNVRRWPNPVNTASILFPRGAKFFGFVATVLMVAGGGGMMAGFQTPISAVMIVIFLIPTFFLHSYWLKTLPAMAPAVSEALRDEQSRRYFRSFDRQAYHAHEVGIRDNLVFLIAAIYFAVRGAAAFGADNLLPHWVIWLFRAG